MTVDRDRLVNPYATPKTDLDPDPQDNLTYPEASRIKRLVAVILDSLFLALVQLTVLFLIDTVTGSNFIDRLFSLDSSQDPADIFKIGLFDITLYGILAFDALVYLSINGYLLATRGQSIGKMIMKIAIVDRTTYEIKPLTSLLLLRYFPFYALQLVMAIIYAVVSLRLNSSYVWDRYFG